MLEEALIDEARIWVNDVGAATFEGRRREEMEMEFPVRVTPTQVGAGDGIIVRFRYDVAGGNFYGQILLLQAKGIRQVPHGGEDFFCRFYRETGNAPFQGLVLFVKVHVLAIRSQGFCVHLRSIGRVDEFHDDAMQEAACRLGELRLALELERQFDGS